MSGLTYAEKFRFQFVALARERLNVVADIMSRET